MLAVRVVQHAVLPGQEVFDPFAGTGNFLVAAARAGAGAQGCDRDPVMVTIAVKRGIADAPSLWPGKTGSSVARTRARARYRTGDAADSQAGLRRLSAKRVARSVMGGGCLHGALA